MMMKGIAKRALTPILVTLSLAVFTSCLSAPVDFDEATWRKSIDETKPELLYAPHNHAGRFHNPWARMPETGFLTVVRWRLFTRASTVYTDEERAHLPAFVPDARARMAKHADRDYILWIGHNSFAVKIGDTLYVTDPMLSNRAVIIKRKVPPAITAAELAAAAPRMVVIITHNHHDHLDLDTVRALPESARFIVPRGVGELIRKYGKRDIVELDWWREAELGAGVRIACVPAQHWSRRIDQGTNRSLWAGFVLIAPKTKILFAGDSGYFAGYREIGRKFPGIDYAFMPITAFHPRWFMHYAHMNVDEALRAFDETGARYFIPTQWGTFPLGEEPVGDAALALKRAIARRGLDPSRFVVMDIGGIEPVRSSRHKTN